MPELVDSTVTYDVNGRMQYHPDYHFAKGKSMTEEERSYLCKFGEIDGYASVALALGKPHASLVCIVNRIRRDGLYDDYCERWNEASEIKEQTTNDFIETRSEKVQRERLSDYAKGLFDACFRKW